MKPGGGATLTHWRGRKGAQPATGDSEPVNPVTKVLLFFFIVVFISFSPLVFAVVIKSLKQPFFWFLQNMKGESKQHRFEWLGMHYRLPLCLNRHYIGQHIDL